MSELYLSQIVMDMLKQLEPKSAISDQKIVYGFPLRVYNLFPFEIMYDACDIETKETVKIASGEWIHGVMVPAMPDFIELVPPKLSFAPEVIEEDRRAFLNSFMFKGRMF